MRRITVLALVAVLALGVLGFAQELGTRGRPIYLLLVPSTEGATVLEVGTQIAEALSEATGLYIEASLQYDYTGMIEAMAASDGDTFGIPASVQYLGIYERTGGNCSIRLASVRYGEGTYYGAIYVRRDSGIESIIDLHGKTWVYNDVGSGSGYVIPKQMFDNLGIVPSGIIESGGHTNTIAALYEGQGDFCTAYYSKPTPPAGWIGDTWEYGDYIERWVWDPHVEDVYAVPGYQTDLSVTCRDVRRALRKTYDFADVVREIKVLMLEGDEIPNDGVCFGPNFPVDVADTIVDAIKVHIASEAGQALWSDENFYEWNEVMDVTDAFYDKLRVTLQIPIPVR
ncbi:PhnD/SsuA/transferrin family substrate-binding protein [Candidatus Bipolaricaulota bacterium]|nr:PhnD/SsuA/transferrin family substrate-binding protein [Candidatus Bipolaricaulota bacterium]